MSSDGNRHVVLDKDGDKRTSSAHLHGRAMLSYEEWQRVGKVLHLSTRELELVEHIFEGKKLSAIARDMQLGLGTIKTYSQRIHRKLSVTDQRELTLAVVDAHWRLANGSR